MLSSIYSTAKSAALTFFSATWCIPTTVLAVGALSFAAYKYLKAPSRTVHIIGTTITDHESGRSSYRTIPYANFDTHILKKGDYQRLQEMQEGSHWSTMLSHEQALEALGALTKDVQHLLGKGVQVLASHYNTGEEIGQVIETLECEGYRTVDV
jgi:hypothetical protein